MEGMRATGEKLEDVCYSKHEQHKSIIHGKGIHLSRWVEPEIKHGSSSNSVRRAAETRDRAEGEF